MSRFRSKQFSIFNFTVNILIAKKNIVKTHIFPLFIYQITHLTFRISKIIGNQNRVSKIQIRKSPHTIVWVSGRFTCFFATGSNPVNINKWLPYNTKERYFLPDSHTTHTHTLTHGVSVLAVIKSYFWSCVVSIRIRVSSLKKLRNSRRSRGKSRLFFFLLRRGTFRLLIWKSFHIRSVQS